MSDDPRLFERQKPGFFVRSHAGPSNIVADPSIGEAGLADIEPRLREAARLFNAREFFGCHDVLEELWNESIGPERDLYQGLLHAAVALFHFSEGNHGGARKMYDSAVRYLTAFLPRESPFDLARLLADLKIAFEPLLTARAYPVGLSLSEDLIPLLHTAAVTEVPA